MAKLCKFIGQLWLAIGLLAILYHAVNCGGSFSDINLMGEMPSWEAVGTAIEVTILPMFLIFACTIPAFAIFYGVGYYLEKTSEEI